MKGHWEKGLHYYLGMVHRCLRVYSHQRRALFSAAKILLRIYQNPMFKKDATLLENVQRRATKMIPALKDVPYPERLTKLRLPSLYYGRARGDMIQTYT